MQRQGFPGYGTSNEAIKVLEHPLLLGCDVGVPHHNEKNDSFPVRIVSCPMEVACVHAKKPTVGAIVANRPKQQQHIY